MRIVHIVNDDKFIDNVISFFDEVGTENKFYCIVPIEKYELQYIKKGGEVTRILENDILNLILRENEYDAIYFHGLPVQLYKYVVEIPKEKKIVWSSWGYDIYYSYGAFSPICKIDLYKPLTKSYRTPREFSLVGFTKGLIKHIIFPVRIYKQKKIERTQRRNALELQNRVLARVDFCSTVLDTEFDMIKRNPYFKAIMIPSPYVIRRDKKSIEDVDFENTGYILLGNSADPSNNYLDIISLLEKRHIKNKIYMPLAYGDVRNKEYLINKFGNNKQCIIQEKFIPYEEYLLVLKKTRAVIMGHIRQQAMGNITESLFNGFKVFLYEDSVVYKYFIEKGVFVFSIEKDLCQAEIDSPLENEKIEFNRNFVLKIWDYNDRVRAIRNTLCGQFRKVN